MRPLAPAPHRHDDARVVPTTATRPGRRAWIAVAGAVVWALGGGTAVAAEAPDATLTVAATVYHAMHDEWADDAGHEEAGHDDAGHEEAGHDEAGEVGHEEPVRTLVEVDGAMHDLTGLPELAGSPTGSDVVLTLEAETGLTTQEALVEVSAAAADGDGTAGTAELVDVAPAGATAQETADGTLPLAEAAVGTHTLTVLPVYGSARDYATRESLGALADTVAGYWADQSGGRIDFTTSVRDWVQYSSPATCDAGAIWNNALAAHGGSVRVSSTQHVVVYFPKRSDCGGWAGMATVGGGQIWINGVPTEDVLAHEVGHNLGLGHANTMTCGSGSTRISLGNPSTCSRREYADRADVMGIGTNDRTGNLTTAAADLLGLATVDRITSTSLDRSVTVDLAPLADVTARRAVSLPAPTFNQGRVYVDFRPAVGRDVRRTAWAGVQVHLRYPDSRGIPNTYLLDMEPTTSTPFTSPAFAPGSSWTVPGTSLRVTVGSVGTTARVTVSSSTASLDTTAPTRAVVTAPAAGAVVTGRAVVRWQPSTDAVGVTGYEVLVDGRVVSRVDATTTSVDLGVLPAGPHGVAVDALDAAGNRSRGAAVAFTAVADETQRYVARVYADLFRRSPDGAGLVTWGTALSNGTPRVAVANAITSSDEFRGRLIQGSYSRYLARGADAGGLASWLDAMRGGLTIQGMEAGFVASPEYYLQSGSDDARWVTRLYQHVLGRTPAAAEVRHWQRELAAGAGREQVARGFLLSTEHLTTVVDGHYRDLLGRGIDPTGAAHWVAAIQRGTRVEAIVGGIIASEEYGARR